MKSEKLLGRNERVLTKCKWLQTDPQKCASKPYVPIFYFP